ncbi:MAG: hypothetical protein K2X74_22575 [Acetobacteraceae bacterium]|nr:hypothetical protein [Acetobacteraceae bacterium]
MSRGGSSISSSRRDALRRLGLLPVALAAAGCGFRPMYGPVESSTGGAPADLAPELAAVRIGDMPERFGQVMRRELQRRFEGTAPGTQARYILYPGVSFSGEVLGYRRDGTISRIRYIATAEWTLVTQSVPPQTIARSGQPIRTIDSFNVPDLQFFAADTSREDMERRLAMTLSSEVQREVILALRRYLADGRSGSAAATPPG